MSLMVNAAILAVIVIVIAGVAFFLIHPALQQPLTKSQAVQIVLKDIQAKDPAANVSVVSVTNSTLQSNSWSIVLSVVYNASRACPSVQIEQFDYPATGLQPSNYNQYSIFNSTGCYVLGYTDAPSYVISFPDIIIARSYASANASVLSYVDKFGYDNTVVSAQYLSDTNSTPNSVYSGLVNVWRVHYVAAGANYSKYVILNPSGQITTAYNSSP